MTRKRLASTKVVALAHRKGGVGKSVSALCIAAEAWRRGYEVILLDADPQGTARTWRDYATEAGLDALPVVAAAAATFRAELAAAPTGTLVVIDPLPAVVETLTEALQLADLAIVPCGPDPADVFALAGTLRLLEAVWAQRPELVARLLLTRCDSRTALGAQARLRAQSYGLPLLRAELSLRTAFKEMVATGMGIADYAPHSAAAAEAGVLFTEVLRLLKRGGR